MTYERREEILSKEVITTKEFAELFGISYHDASLAISAIKRRLDCDGKVVRISTQGKLHVQDYLDCYRIDCNRYGKKGEQPEEISYERTDDFAIE